VLLAASAPLLAWNICAARSPYTDIRFCIQLWGPRLPLETPTLQLGMPMLPLGMVTLLLGMPTLLLGMSILPLRTPMLLLGMLSASPASVLLEMGVDAAVSRCCAHQERMWMDELWGLTSVGLLSMLRGLISRSNARLDSARLADPLIAVSPSCPSSTTGSSCRWSMAGSIGICMPACMSMSAGVLPRLSITSYHAMSASE